MSQDVEWALGDDTGVSSKAIWKTMNGVDAGEWWSWDHPHDPDDLGRCIRLLRRNPEWVERMPEMARHSDGWARLTEHWDELVRLYEEEEPTPNARRSWYAPRTYARMKELLFPQEAVRP